MFEVCPLLFHLDCFEKVGIVAIQGEEVIHIDELVSRVCNAEICVAFFHEKLI